MLVVAGLVVEVAPLVLWVELAVVVELGVLIMLGFVQIVSVGLEPPVPELLVDDGVNVVVGLATNASCDGAAVPLAADVGKAWAAEPKDDFTAGACFTDSVMTCAVGVPV